MPTETENPSKGFDAELLIVGGGLAGLPLAIACARAGVRTIVIDREPPATMLDAPFDGRTTAVAAGSQRVLEAIGVWPHLAAAAEPILDIRITDRAAPFFLHYDHRDAGDGPMGWIVENRVFRAALFAAMAEIKNLRHLAPAAAVAIERGADGVDAMLGDGTRLRARLAVAADGKGSALRSEAGIGTWGAEYRQQSIACTVGHARPHQGVAVEHFLPSGPFAILPMSDNRSSIVWTERKDAVAGFLALPDAEFDRELTKRFGDWLGPIRSVGPRAAYPLQIMLAKRMVAPRLALVGDAAHVIHPIAGQGWNLGLRDVAALAELVVDACRLGLDPGGAALLARYESWRRSDILALAAATDGLNRLFGIEAAPVALARTLGLAAVNRMKPVRQLFMRHAMGLTGNLPRLARGEAL